jgi:hypothetical protein
VDTTIKVGDYVRSYDFAGQSDCYIEGEVSVITPMGGCDRYAIVAQRRVLEGREVTRGLGVTFYPPVNGTAKFFGGMCEGVCKVERPYHPQSGQLADAHDEQQKRRF